MHADEEDAFINEDRYVGAGTFRRIRESIDLDFGRDKCLFFGFQKS